MVPRCLLLPSESYRWTAWNFVSVAVQRNQEAAATEAADSFLWDFAKGKLPAY